MEWREQTSVSCEDAFTETRRWIEEVTSKSFGSSNFRAALENGVLLCDLMNKLKPGIIKRLNRLSTPIAGLDNVNVFLKACAKLGLNESQLFHPGDLQDLSTRVTLRREESNRRLKNVLITVYWLGRKAQLDPFYCGPQLNFKAFEGLLGLTLSKALEEGSGLCHRDGCYGDAEKENLYRVLPAYLREDSVDSPDYQDHRTAHPGSEGCGSDVEADQGFNMSGQRGPAQQRERAYVPPALLRRKRGREENGRGCVSPLARVSHLQRRPGRPPQVNPGWIWSKSTNDLPTGLEEEEDEEDEDDSGDPDVGMPRHPPHGTRSKESEEKWQDDLTKWKNRRRSTNSDLHRKLQEREHVVSKWTNGTVATVGQSKAPNREQLSPSKPTSTSTSPSSKASRLPLRPHTRALLSRSYTVHTLLREPGPAGAPPSCSPVQNQGRPSGAMPASHPLLPGDEVPAASPASDGTSTATTPSACSPYTSRTQIKLQSSPAPLPPTAGLTHTGGRGRRATMGPVPYLSTGSADRTPNSPPITDRKVTSLHHGPRPLGRDVTQQNHGSLNQAGPGAWEEAGLGKGPTHHSSLYRYNTMSWSGSASLPRGYRRSEGSARLSTAVTARPFGTRPSRLSSLPRLSTVSSTIGPVGTSLIRAPLQAENRHAAEKQEVANWVENEQEEEEEEEEGGRTNGLPDCSNLCSTALSDKHLPPPANHSSPAELCQLCVGDVITAVGKAKVEQMSTGQWESTMTSALQTGSLAMDVSRYSNQGCPERHAHTDIMTTPTAPHLPAQGVDIQTRNGEFDEKTQKTASIKGPAGFSSWVYLCGKVPSLNPSASNWSWDHEEERKRQERWQEEQERHRQERYQRDQQRLQAEWRRAEEGAGEGPKERPDWQGNPGVVRPASPTRPAVYRPAPHWAAEKSSVRHQSTETGSVRVHNADPPPVRSQTADPAAVGPLGTETGSEPHSVEAEDKDKLSEPDLGKSKSTPTLASLHRLPKGSPGKPSKVAKASKAEQDRQQILEEMKKRTQLLTDNSWIRQRRASTLKEPLSTGAPLRRYESLDSLDSSDPPSELAGVARPRSAAGFPAPGRSISPRYTTCSTLPDQLTSSITSSQLSFPEATGLSQQAGR
ncbi:unnamed protein product [Merluccius merluccius]